jgi:isoleucyl-tRNA synthetase
VWHAVVFGGEPEHVGYVPAGTYANRGGFHVAVTRIGASA